MLMVGVNGSGKTTFLGKLAHRLTQDGKKVLLVAADTFRAAATEQLQVWGEQTGADVFTGRDGQDPASVVFDGCKTFIEGNYDHLLIDTAGRLQTKINLMNELSKIKKIIARHLPDEHIHTWLTIDSMLGQSSMAQAEVFNESTTLDGIVLTKYDGTGKGGILFAISEKLNLPVQYLTFGEQIDKLAAFDRTEYVQALLSE
jgi:fused signal recognition particle receptor